MADMILYVHTKFCEGLIVALRLEDRVITEALPSPTFSDYLTFYDAFEFMNLFDACATARTYVFFLYYRYYSTETGHTIVFAV